MDSEGGASPDWSPDGKRLALSLWRDRSNADIYVVDLATLQLEQVTQEPDDDTHPSWSHDGEVIYFESARAGQTEIFAVTLRDKSVSRVTLEGTYNAQPEAAPDGKHLAYVTIDSEGRKQIAVKSLQDGRVRVLAPDGAQSPSFAANGQELLYFTSVGEGFVLWSTHIETGKRESLGSRDQEISGVAWGPFLP